MVLFGSRPPESPTPMSYLFLCFSLGFFRAMSLGSWESTHLGTAGYRQKLRGPHSMKSQTVLLGNEQLES